MRVGLIGAGGHGKWHRRRIASLDVTLAGMADPAPVEDAGDVPVFTDHRELLSSVPLDVVVICTPPHTHLPIALDALRAGCDLLLEKPPVVSRAEHEVLATALASTGRACQVGFQALGSAALARLVPGTYPRVATVASWQRDDAYYARATWAGRQGLGDGALVNPLAHALMQSLAVIGDDPVSLTAERYRTRPIATDDTVFARVGFRGGATLLAAVTLAGEDFIAGEVIADGPAGRVVLEYPTDRLRLPGSDPVEVPGRIDLLDNLIAHRRDGTPLVAPLARTLGFTTLAAALTGGPLPALLDDAFITDLGAGAGRVRVITGINAVLWRAASTGRLPSELDVPWASSEGALHLTFA
ncbi:Gfo/Idh/MocA family oxidoreductase [Actinoplanes sp. NPDC051470]|uniref:Gfo/Idh/MocA family protein n=1 Tax=Actinoplanes sp. NPDC051470 TaxID=3157224 RepID=UPI00342E89D0